MYQIRVVPKDGVLHDLELSEVLYLLDLMHGVYYLLYQCVCGITRIMMIMMTTRLVTIRRFGKDHEDHEEVGPGCLNPTFPEHTRLAPSSFDDREQSILSWLLTPEISRHATPPKVIQ